MLVLLACLSLQALLVGLHVLLFRTGQGKYKARAILLITSCCLHAIVKGEPCKKGFLMDLQIVRHPKEWRKDPAATGIWDLSPAQGEKQKERKVQVSRGLYFTLPIKSSRFTRCWFTFPLWGKELYLLVCFDSDATFLLFLFFLPLNSFKKTWLAGNVNHIFIAIFTLLFIFFKLMLAPMILYED